MHTTPTKALLTTLTGLCLLLIMPAGYAAERVTYYHNDALGSPVAATDQNGNLLWRETYAPYGERLKEEDGGSSNRWFTGKQEEAAFGINYFGARWYDPSIGRFMAIDPVGFSTDNIQSFNRYAYANNNPYKYVDPDGEFAILAALAVVGAVALIYELTSMPKVPFDSGLAISSAGPGDVVGAAAGLYSLKNLFGATTGALSEARAARDALSASASTLSGGKRPATVTGGFNTQTGEVAARACGGGKCAEDNVLDALGGNKANVKFTEAVRPRTGEQVPVCIRCEGNFGRDAFPKNSTKFKSDN